MFAFPSLAVILGNGFPAYPTGDVAKDAGKTMTQLPPLTPLLSVPSSCLAAEKNAEKNNEW